MSDKKTGQGHVVAGGAAVFGRRLWAAPLLRGLVAIALGILLLVDATLTVTWFLWLLGGFLLLDGVIALVGALRARTAVEAGRSDEAWLWRAVLAGVGIAAGLVVLIAPDWTRSVLVTLLTWWALGTGVLGVISALRQRRSSPVGWEWSLATALLALVLGSVLLARPDAVQTVVATVLATFALSIGVLLIVGAIAIREATARIAEAITAASEEP